MKKPIFLAHGLGLVFGGLGWWRLVQVAPPAISRPTWFVVFSLYWIFFILIQRRAGEKWFPSPAWDATLAFLQKMLGVLLVAAPLYWVGEQIKGGLPFGKVLTVILYLLYWMALGLMAKAWLGDCEITLPPLWPWREEKHRSLWDLLLWVNANVFLACLVFKGTRYAMTTGGGGGWNLLGIGIVIVAMYMLSLAATCLCCLGLSAREQVQVNFALNQKGAPFWLATGETSACGLILAIEAPLCNLWRIMWLTLANCWAPGKENKKLTKPVIARKVLVNGPMVGVLGGIVVLLLRLCGQTVPPGILLGIDLGAYPFVPTALFLIGTSGLWQVLTWRLEPPGGKKAKDLIGPFVFVLVGSLLIIPLAAHVCCWWLCVKGWLEHTTALGLAQFFSHGCSPTAWGLVALMLGKEDARLYLLFFVITVVGSALSVPIIYGTCAF